MNASAVKRERDWQHFSEEQSWLFICADMLLLLLTMFVMRISMSDLELPTLLPIGSHFQEASLAKEGKTRVPDFNSQLAELSSQKRLVITEIISGLSSELGAGREPGFNSGDLQFPSGFNAKLDGDTLSFTLPESAFAGDSADLTFQARELCLLLASHAKEKAVKMEIISVVEPEVASPWMLSVERTNVVLRQMIDAGVEETHLIAASYVGKLERLKGKAKLDSEKSVSLEIRLIQDKTYGK